MPGQHNRASLRDFVLEQKQQSGGGSSLLQSGVSDIKAKFVNGFNFTRFTNSESDLSKVASTSGDGTPIDGRPTSSSRWFDVASGSEGACGLSRMQRVFGFFGCIIFALVCFSVAFMYLPLLVLKSRKFAALNTLGSCFLLASFALLWGPMNYVQHLCSAPRLPVTAAYLCTLFATLYAALFLQSTVITLICSIAQAVALLWFVLSAAPGGERGLRALANLCSRFACRGATAKAMLPV